MGKEQRKEKRKITRADVSAASKVTSLVVSEADFDPVLASLFTDSAGPVKLHPHSRSRNAIPSTVHTAGAPIDQDGDLVEDGAVVLVRPDDVVSQDGSKSEPARKRRRKNDDDNLEAEYLKRLLAQEEKELQAQLLERSETHSRPGGSGDNDMSNTASDVEGGALDNDKADDSASSASNELLDLSDAEANEKSTPPPVHETLRNGTANVPDINRTVFLSNVSTEAIKAKASRKILIAHIKSALDAQQEERVVSIRFRSTAYDVSSGLKRAAFAKKEVMEATAKSTNAYVILSSEAAARRCAKKLNASMVLDRHIHVDAFVQPMHTDHKRCVFVGNLPFVDEETSAPQNEPEEGGKRNRPQSKTPADAEEGLWRTFAKCGKVESVRLVRDRATRVGKGFAYVQFEDENGVEKALLYDGKKFPPLLPRYLRVSRAKRILRKDQRHRQGRTFTSDAATSSRSSRPSRLRRNQEVPGRQIRTGSSSTPMPNKIVFEGHRASREKDKTKVRLKSRVKDKPTGRSAKRGAAFKAGRGKKKRDMA